MLLPKNPASLPNSEHLHLSAQQRENAPRAASPAAGGTALVVGSKKNSSTTFPPAFQPRRGNISYTTCYVETPFCGQDTRAVSMEII